MIFVTVGTHEQQFNRLIKCVDELKKNNIIQEDVVIQTGFSDYKPRFCEWEKLYPYQQMNEFVDKARIVITHGGPSSFIMPLQIGKIPIVVPRQKKFEEHVNNHQVDFCDRVAKRYRNIIVVNEIDKLQNIIVNYDSLLKNVKGIKFENNLKFCEKLENIVDSMFEN